MSDAKLDLYNANIPGQFTFIANVSVTANPGGLPDVVVALVEEAGTREAHINFRDATAVVIGDVNRGVSSRIEIRDIRAKHLEHVQYDVVDSAGNLLKLKCWDFDFMIEGRP